jgi:hypothetical protein
MTQFMLVIGSQPQNIDVICRSIGETDKFLKKAAHQLLTDRQLELCWYPEGLHGESVHDLFSQAQTQIIGGENIEETIIGKLLIKVFQSCREVLIWYSNDFNDLPEFTNVEIAMNEICSELIELSGEVYLKFKGRYY